MRTLLPILGLLAACGQRSDAPAKRSSDGQWKSAYTSAECKALTARDAFLQRCFGGDLKDENYVGDLRCMPYSPTRRMTGIWLVSLEYSAFFPGALSYADVRGRPDEIWLQAKAPLPREVVAAGQGAGTRAYAIDLVGRRSLCKAHYGHFGTFPEEVIAGHIVAIRPIPVGEP
jgi:hypothetical protein